MTQESLDKTYTKVNEAEEQVRVSKHEDAVSLLPLLTEEIAKHDARVDYLRSISGGDSAEFLIQTLREEALKREAQIRGLESKLVDIEPPLTEGEKNRNIVLASKLLEASDNASKLLEASDNANRLEAQLVAAKEALIELIKLMKVEFATVCLYLNQPTNCVGLCCHKKLNPKAE